MELEQAREMGRALLDEHGLGQWSLAFDRAKRRAGMCRYATSTISLSKHLTELHEPDLVRDTLLHEIAHALAGPEAGHGRQWRAIAAQIGARPQRLLPADAPVPPAPWQGQCPGGHEHRRFRRPDRPVSCSRCCPIFCLAHLIDWTRDGAPMTMTPGYRKTLQQSRRRAARRQNCPHCGHGPRARAPEYAEQPPASGRAEPEPVLLW